MSEEKGALLCGVTNEGTMLKQGKKEIVAQRKADIEAKTANLKAQPHVVYGAKVFLTVGETTPETKWTCGLVYDGVNTQIIGVGQIAPGWYYSFPCATGPTPKAACEAFDRLWEFGDAKAESKPKRKKAEKEDVIVEIDQGIEGPLTCILACEKMIQDHEAGLTMSVRAPPGLKVSRLEVVNTFTGWATLADKLERLLIEHGASLESMERKGDMVIPVESTEEVPVSIEAKLKIGEDE